MTPDNHNSPNALGGGIVDKLLDHNRLQLSALVDGELSPHEARFLLRRLQHDPELADCWDRWNLCGDVLRGRIHVVAPNGFSKSVAATLASEPLSKTTTVAADYRWLRWGGGAALAASVAMVALLLGRLSPNAGPPAMASAQVVASTAAQPASATHVATGPSAAPAAELATALAVSEIPRRLMTRRSRGQSQRAALRTTSREIVQAPMAAASGPIDPFSAEHASLITRPWPRALLPTSPANGAFTVDYGNRSGEGAGVNAPSFFPFEPRVPVSASSTPRNPP